MDEEDKGRLMTTIGVSRQMFLLVPAHPGCPGQNPESRKMVDIRYLRMGGAKNLKWVTQFVVHRLGLDMITCTPNLKSMFTHYAGMKGNAKCRN